MNAIMVSVDYSDLLAVTLPYNRHHFNRVMVVTSLTDQKTMRIASENRAEVHATDAFYRNGAIFNKWAALEEGLGVLGREGWLCVMDADVLWPKNVNTLKRARNLKDLAFPTVKGNLYTPFRRMLIDLSEIRNGVPSEDRWSRYPFHPQQQEFAGYSQIFHASDPVLGPAPWHQVDWNNCSGADSYFQAKWSADKKIRPSFYVLHLGPSGTNWLGRASPYIDGTLPEESKQKMKAMQQLFMQRAGKRGDERFASEKLRK